MTRIELKEDPEPHAITTVEELRERMDRIDIEEISNMGVDPHILRGSRKRKRRKNHKTSKLRVIKVENYKETHKFQDKLHYESILSETLSQLSTLKINMHYGSELSETVRQLSKLEIRTQSDSPQDITYNYRENQVLKYIKKMKI